MAGVVGIYGIRESSGQSTTRHSSPSPDWSSYSSGEACCGGDTAFYDQCLEEFLYTDVGEDKPYLRVPSLEEQQQVPSPASTDECTNACVGLQEHSGSDDNSFVMINVHNTGLSWKVYLRPGQMYIEKETLHCELVQRLGFQPDYFLVDTASVVGEPFAGEPKWDLPRALVTIPADRSLLVSVGLPPASVRIPQYDWEMASRPALLPIEEPSLPEPPGQIAVAPAFQPPEQMQRSGSSSPEPLQSREVLEALYRWMRRQKLFKPELVDLSLPPWELIGWNDPSMADRDPTTRHWLLMGKLRYKVENGTWKRDLHTAGGPSRLTQSRWWNRNKNLKKKVQLDLNVEAHVVRRYFKWVPGNKEGMEAGKRWQKYDWLLHEDVPAEVVGRQSWNVNDGPEPEYYGLFKLTLKDSPHGKAEHTNNPFGQQPVEARGTKRGFGEGSSDGASGQPRPTRPDMLFNSVCNGQWSSNYGGNYYGHHEEGWEWVDGSDGEGDSDLSEGVEEWGGGEERDGVAPEELGDAASAAEGRRRGADSVVGEGDKCQTEAQEELVEEMRSLGISSSSSLASSASSGPREFLASELALLTTDFCERLDEGANEELYEGFKGTLEDGCEVAVKRGRVKISSEAFEEMKQKQAQVSHRNLTPMVGFCTDEECQALVFSLPKGPSLHTRLYGKRGPDNPMLSWPHRLHCAVDILSALEYLHKKHAVPHGRLSSSNVHFTEPSGGGSTVLANWMVPGLTDVLGKVYEGSDEYLSANEYYNTEFYGGQPDRLSDVAALGMLLLEIISGRAPYNSTLPAEQARLLPWAQTCYKEKAISKFVDGELLPLLDTKELAQALRLMKLALRCCTQRDRTTRPSVLEATSKVLGIIENMKWSPVGTLEEGGEGPAEGKAEMSSPWEVGDKVPAGLYGLQHAVFDASTSKSKEAAQ